MNRADIERELIEICSTFLGHPVDNTLVRAVDGTWDSLRHMQIIFAVEEKFGVQFTEEEIPVMDSLARFADYLEQCHAA